MGCVDCTNNCPEVISDCCVKYTGDDIPALGICTGDLVCEIEKIIIDKLLETIEGEGITLAEVTLDNCTYLKDKFVGKEKNLVNILQLLIDNQCTLKDLITDLQLDPITFNAGCLTGLSANPTRDEVLSAAVTKLCLMSTTLAAVPITYVKITDINTYIQAYLNSLTPSQGETQYYKSIPAKVALPYFGDLAKFDNTGKGLDAYGFKNIFVCNGANGTPDLRGRAVVGAVNNIPGGSLDAAVDPALPTNPGTNYTIADKFGSSYVTLTTNQMPAHNHSTDDPGHTHTYEKLDPAGHPSGSSNTNPRNATSAHTGLSLTGLTIMNAGGGAAHENRQPSIAACWIMAIY